MGPTSALTQIKVFDRPMLKNWRPIREIARFAGSVAESAG
jgi:hypothetical protein